MYVPHVPAAKPEWSLPVRVTVDSAVQQVAVGVASLVYTLQKEGHDEDTSIETTVFFGQLRTSEKTYPVVPAMYAKALFEIKGMHCKQA